MNFRVVAILTDLIRGEDRIERGISRAVGLA